MSTQVSRMFYFVITNKSTAARMTCFSFPVSMRDCRENGFPETEGRTRTCFDIADECARNMMLCDEIERIQVFTERNHEQIFVREYLWK